MCFVLEMLAKGTSQVPVGPSWALEGSSLPLGMAGNIKLRHSLFSEIFHGIFLDHGAPQATETAESGISDPGDAGLRDDAFVTDSQLSVLSLDCPGSGL